MVGEPELGPEPEAVRIVGIRAVLPFLRIRHAVSVHVSKCDPEMRLSAEGNLAYGQDVIVGVVFPVVVQVAERLDVDCPLRRCGFVRVRAEALRE